MRKMSTDELRQLEVINLCGGERLGYPCEFEIDIDDGRILSFTVPKNNGFSLFGKKDELMIPWCKIECIGEDAILVKITQNELSNCECFCKTGRKGRFFK
ncbi:MAG: YlmC/YmxH family sporulation protein [Clostridia bacterium]|nr:YlmC/YmxH family sporulation protein [Clostridia bacterium]